jgi:hypothetical protein
MSSEVWCDAEVSIQYKVNLSDGSVSDVDIEGIEYDICDLPVELQDKINHWATLDIQRILQEKRRY